MGHPGAKTIDELIEHEFAFHEILVIVANLAGNAIQEFGLDLSQRLGRHPAIPGQTRIGLLPLAKLMGTLTLVQTDLANQFLKQFILTVLARKSCRNKPPTSKSLERAPPLAGGRQAG